ncbi:MAG: DUF4878 domain-containing protein [Bacteroidales bacterium]|nr:DUF4878 domain-containing protein [Bacteroidales bacterium]
MKKIVLRALLLLSCLPGLSACTSSEKRAHDVARQFLDAYYTGEYGQAAALCTPAYAAKLSKIADVQGIVPEAIAQKMKEAVSGTSFKIVSVDVDEEATSAVVHYELTVPGIEGPVSKQLHLQLEGRTAAVNGIE